MRNQTKLIVVAGAALAIATGGVGVAVATGGDDSEPPIGGTALERARAAALGHVGRGRVSETEVGDEESLYEVEVTRPDGTQIDVQLDRGFHVVGSEADSENGSEPGEDQGSP
jgi:hypothetical protein